MSQLFKIKFWPRCIAEVNKVLSKQRVGSKCLFLFDLDDVIIQVRGYGSSSWFYKELDKYELDVLENIYTLFLLENPAKIVDTVVAPFLQSLQAAGHDTVGLTARSSKLMTSTLRDLALNDVSFDQNGRAPFYYNRQGYQHGDNALFVNNVYFAAGKNKGIIAKELLRGKSYDHVFFFDDEPKNVTNFQTHVNFVPTTLFNLYGYREIANNSLENAVKLENYDETMAEKVADVIKKLRDED